MQCQYQCRYQCQGILQKVAFVQPALALALALLAETGARADQPHRVLHLGVRRAPLRLGVGRRLV